MRVTIPNLFFLNKQLHRKIRVIRAEAAVVCWNYPDEERKWYLIADVRKEYQQAFRVDEVAKLIDRSRAEILKLLRMDLISHPTGRSFDVKTKTPKFLFWSEDDVLKTRQEIWDLVPLNKWGEPRRTIKLASKAEVLSAMTQGSSYYVKNEKGDYIKIWKA